MELSCKELVELVTDYLEGALSPEERQRFEAHLAQCTGCRRYLLQMEKTIRLTGKLNENDIQPPASDEFLRVFRDWYQTKPPIL